MLHLRFSCVSPLADVFIAPQKAEKVKKHVEFTEFGDVYVPNCLASG